MPVADIVPFLTNGPAIGILTWFVYQVLQGNIITRKIHDNALEESNKRAETWKQVAETYKNSLEKKDEVVPAQLASARTVGKLAEALQSLTTDSEEKKP
jgi:hypothetical protein